MRSPATRKRDPSSEWDEARPWKRQPCDVDDTAWELFQRYLYQHNRPRILQVPKSLFQRAVLLQLSARWDYRCEVFDAARDAKRESMLDRHLEVARLKQDVGILELKALRRRQRAPEYEPGLVKPRDALALAERGVSLERQLAGLAPVATGAPEGESGPGLAALTPDEVETLRILAAKMRGEM